MNSSRKRIWLLISSIVIQILIFVSVAAALWITKVKDVGSGYVVPETKGKSLEEIEIHFERGGEG